MFKALAATTAVVICCLGNPADASQRRCVKNCTTDSSTSIADDQINHTGHTYNNRHRTVEGDVIRTDNSGNNRGNTTTNNTTANNTNNTNKQSQRQSQSQVNRQTNRQSNNQRNNNNQEVHFNEVIQHAPIPQPVGPAAPDSVAVLTIYGQVDEAGPVAGASISIPLF